MSVMMLNLFIVMIIVCCVLMKIEEYFGPEVWGNIKDELDYAKELFWNNYVMGHFNKAEL